MIVLSFTNVVTKAKRFDITVNIGTGAVEATYYPWLSKFGSFKFGSRNDDEMIFFPGTFEFSFRIQPYQSYNSGTKSFIPSKSDADYIYKNILTKLKDLDTTAEVFVYNAGTNDLFFRAFMETDNKDFVSGEIYTREISVMFMDDYSTLNQPPLIYHNATGFNRIYELWPAGENFDTIKSITAFLNGLLPNVTINMKTDFRFIYFNASDQSYNYCGLSDVGAPNYVLFDAALNSSRGSLLKAILYNFASYAVIDSNRVLNIVPRYYDGSPVININRANIIGQKLTFRMARTYNGLVAQIGYINPVNGVLQYANNGYPESRVASRIDDPLVKIITYPFGVGGTSGNYDNSAAGFSKLLFKADGKPLLVNRVSYRKSDGIYSTEKSLGEWAGQLNWEVISNSGSDYVAELPGVDYSFTNYFGIESGAKIYRPINMQLDCNKDTTTVTLRECTNSDVSIPVWTGAKFTSPLKANNVTVKVGTREYIADNNDVKIFADQITLRCDNIYKSSLSSVEQYDGKILNIADNQLSIFEDDFKYLVYLYVSDNNQPPSSDYPTANEQNGRWYYLESVDGGTTLNNIETASPDYYHITSAGSMVTNHLGDIVQLVPLDVAKITDSLARVEYKAPLITGHTKYWFAIYVTTADTFIFPGIPRYGK